MLMLKGFFNGFERTVDKRHKTMNQILFFDSENQEKIRSKARFDLDCILWDDPSRIIVYKKSKVK